jgi:glycosyltransferase involved in cell wall biosynthesis
VEDEPCSKHLLLITHLPLTRLRQNVHGTYRRLSVLVQSMAHTGFPLRLVSTVEPGSDASAAPETTESIEEELRSAWGVDVTVRLAERSLPSRQRWIVQQSLGLLSYRNQPSIRTLMSSQLRNLLAEELALRPRFIMAHRLPSMFALLAFRDRLPVVYFDMDDVEHVVTVRALTKAGGVREKFFMALSLPSLMLAERRAARAATKTFVCSAEDARYLASIYSPRGVGLLPNAVDILPYSSVAKSKVLLMVGSYVYGPNADGANYMVEHVYPLIREKVPQAELWFVGAGCEAIKSFGSHPPGTRFLGFVDDLAAVYEAARVVVCPIRYGGGTRVKLIEAAAYSKPIVTTTVGAEGLGMSHNVDALFADDPRSFADACIRLLNEEEPCVRLGKGAWRLAASRFDREQIIDRLRRDIYEAVG